MMGRTAWPMLALAGAAGMAAAAPPAVEGSLRAAWYTESAEFDQRGDVAATALWLKTSPALSDNVTLVAEGWVRNDNTTGDGPTRARMREGYLDVTGEAWDLRLGQQLIIWGRADRINPTDNVTPRDYTMLTPEDVDQRRGVQAMRLRYRNDAATVSAYWLPVFRPSTMPMAAPPGLRWHQQTPSALQGALRIDGAGTVDWSLSYLNALDVNPDLQVQAAGPSGVDVALIHRRVRVLGADAATVVGRYGLRAEAAYTWTGSSADPLVKKPFLYLVAGGDRTFGEHFNVNLQYYLRHVTHWQDPRQLGDPALRALALGAAVGASQGDRFQHGFTYRIANKWWNETLEGELAGVVSLTRRDWAFKPRLTYALSDHWRATAGMNWYRGEEATFFGALAPTSSAFVELRYGF
ncbi:MAG: hypothetical protein ACJ8GW_02485 [Massilia sp.]